VCDEFEGYLKCGRLEHGYLRVVCESRREEKLVAFSCKGRGFCPSCGAKRMVEGAALLVDEILPEAPVRQWVISFPFQLRILFARHPEWLTQVQGIVWRVLSGHLIRKAGQTRKRARTGAVTLTAIQGQSSARANLKQTKMSAPLGVQHWLEKWRRGDAWSEFTEQCG
jgi:hypothetical protein